MTEQIERDRDELRANEGADLNNPPVEALDLTALPGILVGEQALASAAKKPRNRISYAKHAKSKRTKQPRVPVSIQGLTTLNILHYVEESFFLCDKYILDNLVIIENELRRRSDLFESAAAFLEKAEVKDDLHYWIPGLTVNNIFSFIELLIPDFVPRYKRLFIHGTIVGNPVPNCIRYIKERFRSEYPPFLVMARDMAIFEQCVSLPYWLDGEANESRRFLGVEEKLVLAEDIEAVLTPDLSYVDLSINERSFVVTLHEYEGLVARDEAMKPLWMSRGVVDESWRFLV